MGVTLAVRRGRLKRRGFRLGQESNNPDGMEGREGTENRKLDHRGVLRVSGLRWPMLMTSTCLCSACGWLK